MTTAAILLLCAVLLAGPAGAGLLGALIHENTRRRRGEPKPPEGPPLVRWVWVRCRSTGQIMRLPEHRVTAGMDIAARQHHEP